MDIGVNQGVLIECEKAEREAASADLALSQNWRIQKWGTGAAYMRGQADALALDIGNMTSVPASAPVARAQQIVKSLGERTRAVP